MRRSQHHPVPLVAPPIACAIAIGILAFAGDHASAQNAAQAAPVETMVVTGTRGRERSVLDTPVPIDVLTRDDLASAGAFGGELGVALQVQVPSFNFQRQSNSGAADLVRPAQLRGMSPDQTLVLINGKRRHTTSVTGIDAKVGRGTAPVDFNSIPSSAIARIEVLRDGAGSQYGSDAIAGVINVILDERDHGLDLSLEYGGHRTDFEPADDISDGETKSATLSYGLPLGDGFIRVGAEYKEREETDRGGRGDVPFFEDSANEPLVGGGRNFKPGDGASEDTLLWANFAVPIGEHLELYGFATYAERDAEGTGFFRYPVSSANIRSVYPLGYRPITTGENEDFGMTLGARGQWAEWNWDASLTQGQNDFEIGVTRSLNPSLGSSSPRSFASGSSEFGQVLVNLDANRLVNIGLPTEATLAIGAEYRREDFESRAGDPASFAAGPFAGDPDFLSIGAQAGGGLRPEEARDLDRDVWSLYGELSADLTEQLFVDVSARIEDSDDYGSTLAGKLAARWQFVPDWALRGSIGNSYRAPSLVQLGFGTSSTSFGAGGQLTTVNTLPIDDAVAQALGAEDLDEESAVNFTVGLTGSPIDGLNLSIDLFRIDVEDRITLSERIDCTPALTALCGTRNITAANFFTNAVETSTEGVDVVVTYGLEAWHGELELSAAYTYAKTDIEEVATARNPGVVLVGVEESNTIEDAAPRDKFVLSANYGRDRLDALVRVTRWGETTRVFNFGGGFEPTQTYDREWQVDVEARYEVMKGVTAYLGISNLFDEYPDESSDDINFFGNLPYDVLSPIGMNGRYLYTGLRASF